VSFASWSPFLPLISPSPRLSPFPHPETVGYLVLASPEGPDPGAQRGPRLVTSLWPLSRVRIQGTRDPGWLPHFGLCPGARSRAHGAKVGYLVLASAQRPDLGAQGNTVSYLVLASTQRPDPGAQQNLSSNIPFHIWPYPICVLKGQTERQIDKGSHQMWTPFGFFSSPMFHQLLGC
jgi:hypothetical protein